MKANSFASQVAGAWCALIVLCAAAPAARADGGAGPEAMMMGNMCMVMFGYDMIHITSYLPGMSRSEYCEEIPATGKVIMVFDIETVRFRELPDRNPHHPRSPDAGHRRHEARSPHRGAFPGDSLSNRHVQLRARL